jgi:hypothetical protein
LSNFGLPPFTPAYQPAPPPQEPPRGSSRAFLYFLLILVCAGLGAIFAWGRKQHSERVRLSERNRAVEDAYVFVVARGNDLASFMADPRTRLFRLSGRGDLRTRQITIAWQEERRTGMVIWDQLPPPGDDECYSLWMTPRDAQTPVFCGSFRPDSGVHFHRFQFNGASPAASAFAVGVTRDKNPTAPQSVVFQ